MQAPQIKHIHDLPRQRTALLKDPDLCHDAECIVKEARVAVDCIYGKVGMLLGEDQLIVEFLEQSTPQGQLELKQNKGARGYNGANGFLAEYIMQRWVAQFRSHRPEPTYKFEGVTVDRTCLVVDGVSEDQILSQQSKRGSNAMHDQQIEAYQLEMQRRCVQVICWQGDTGTTSSAHH